MIDYYYEHLKRTKKEYEEEIEQQEKKVKKAVDYLKLLKYLRDENQLQLVERSKSKEKG